MEPTERSQRSTCPKSSKSKRKARGLEGDSVPTAETGKAEATATTSGNVSVGGRHTSPQSAQRVSSPPSAMGSIAGPSSAGTSGNPLRRVGRPTFLPQDILNRKVNGLVRFLLLKYRMNKQATKAEILDRITSEYEVFYNVIFSKTADYMWLLFGIDIIEVDQNVHSYFLVTALGITYDGMQHGVQGIPKTGLVITMLCIIFMEDNCVGEHVVWEILNTMGLYAGREHVLYGEPRRLITKHFVQEGYLDYRQVPGSDPPSHEFLWGPRAHVETTKMKILNFFASAVRQNPKSYPFRYAEALLDEVRRRQARITPQRILLP